MALAAIAPAPRSELLSYIESQTGQKISCCYQCGKCSAGCPTVPEMDLTPRQVMRAIQLGLKDELMQSTTIWLCIGCQTCSVRCPREIDIARVMEVLRLLAFVERVKPGEKDIKLFHNLFLGLVERFGRLYELGLGGAYNLRSGHLLANMELAPSLLAKGKLSLVPPGISGIKGAKEIRHIHARVKELEGA